MVASDPAELRIRNPGRPARSGHQETVESVGNRAGYNFLPGMAVLARQIDPSPDIHHVQVPLESLAADSRVESPGPRLLALPTLPRWRPGRNPAAVEN